MKSSRITLQQPESCLWETTEIMRGDMDASEFKDYFFGMMFLKRLSDAFEEAQERVVAYCLGKGITQGSCFAASSRQGDKVCVPTGRKTRQHPSEGVSGSMGWLFRPR